MESASNLDNRLPVSTGGSFLYFSFYILPSPSSRPSPIGRKTNGKNIWSAKNKQKLQKKQAFHTMRVEKGKEKTMREELSRRECQTHTPQGVLIITEQKRSFLSSN